MPRDWPELRSPNVVSRAAFDQGSYQNGFYDASWGTDVQPSSSSRTGITQGKPSLCANIHAHVSIQGMQTGSLQAGCWML